MPTNPQNSTPNPSIPPRKTHVNTAQIDELRRTYKVKTKKNTKKKNRVNDKKNTDKQLKNSGVKKAVNDKKKPDKQV